MENRVASRSAIVLMLVALFFIGPAYAGGSCSLSLRPETSGFFLNPVLEKVVIAKAVPTAPGIGCPLMANDEILQVNDQVIPGQRANKVMGYWKALKADSPRVFKVRRAGAILSVDIR
jgi:hypothetical protein